MREVLIVLVCLGFGMTSGVAFSARSAVPKPADVIFIRLDKKDGSPNAPAARDKKPWCWNYQRGSFCIQPSTLI